MYFNADIVNILGSQAKPNAKLLQGNAPLLPFPLGVEGSWWGKQEPSLLCSSAPLQRCRARPQNPWG